MQNIKWVFSYIKRKKILLIVGMVLVVVNACLELLQIAVQKEILDEIIYIRSVNKIVFLIAVLAFFYIGTSVLFLEIGTINHRIFYYWREKVILKLHGKIQRLSMSHFENERIANLTALFSDVERVGDDLFNIPYKIGDFVKLILMSAIICKLNYKIFLFLVVINVALSLYLKKVSPKVQQAGKDIIRNRYDMLTHFEEGVSGEREIIANNYQINFIEKLVDIFAKYKSSVIEETNAMNKMVTLSTLVRWIGLFCVIMFTYTEVVKGSITIGTFYILYQYVNKFSDLFNQVNNSLFEIIKIDVKVQKIRYSMEDMEELEFTAGINFQDDLKSIFFKNVQFSYDHENIILDDFSAPLNIGEKNAIIGASGCGKSTLADILLKNYELMDGECIINGNFNLSQISLQSWLKKVCIVYQESYLFQDTIRNNILLGKTGISDEKIMKVCDSVMLGDLIRSLPNCLDEMVGDRGINISGGQRQRLALARALICDKEMLIMDEATAALDEYIQSVVQVNIDALYRNKTLVIIAHRLSTIANSQNVIEFKT